MNNTLTATAPALDIFSSTLAAQGQDLLRTELNTLQINLGKLCNLACHHCHVEAGPKRLEIMDREVMDRILQWIDTYREDLVQNFTVDLTGGAPEMNPHFRYFVQELRSRDLRVLDRSNLSILLEPGYEDMVDFLAAQQVEIVASLPCYLQENVDKQRGLGTYNASIEAIRRLNAVGYGREGSSLKLDLVYNPVGSSFPPPQAALEADYKRELKARFKIVFNVLWTITNMPIKRFHDYLVRNGQLAAYKQKLQEAHNPNTVDAVMCRSLLSVDWEGIVFDCDFNQMLELPLGAYVSGTETPHLWDLEPRLLLSQDIATASHCFGCTAGAGSSCTGSLE